MARPPHDGPTQRTNRTKDAIQHDCDELSIPLITARKITQVQKPNHPNNCRLPCSA